MAIQNTVEAMEQFEQILKSNVVVTKTKETARERLDLLQKNIPVCHPSRVAEMLTARAKALQNAIEDFVESELGKIYPRLDTEAIKKFKRHIAIEKATDGTFNAILDKTVAVSKEEFQVVGEKFKITIPLFAWAKFGTTGVPVANLVNSTKRHVTYNGETDTNVAVTAKLAGSFGTDLRLKYREGLSNYYKAITELYQHEAADTLVGESVPAPEFWALWIPRISDLDIKVTSSLVPKDYDPALVMHVRDRSYLIATWKIEEEEPMDYYIREFTTGKLPK